MMLEMTDGENLESQPLKNLEKTDVDKSPDNHLTEKSEGTLSLWALKSFRLYIAFALAGALTVEGLMRSNINMAMVCMVNQTAIDEFGHTDVAGFNSSTDLTDKELYCHKTSFQQTNHMGASLGYVIIISNAYVS